MRLLLSVTLSFFFSSLLGQAPLPKLEVVPVNQELTFWAVSVVNDRVAWVSANKGTIARTVDGGKTWVFSQVTGAEKLEFKSIYAFDEASAAIANVGSPAYIFKTVDGGKNWSRVYENLEQEAFIDGIDFWNGKEGVAYGDPIKGKMLLIRTSDGGTTWTTDKDCSTALAEGQASFASSGTGIRCVGNNKVFIATGGTVSQLLMSNDKGNTWHASEPLLRQGSKTGGIFSVSFLNEKDGIVIGGDFADSTATELGLYTTDGGKTWKRPARDVRGTRWCVEHIDGQTAVAVGPSGADITHNGGLNWAALTTDHEYHVVRKARTGKLVIIAGSKSKLALIR